MNEQFKKNVEHLKKRLTGNISLDNLEGMIGKNKRFFITPTRKWGTYKFRKYPTYERIFSIN